ncbi:MAG: SigF/SigG family RNA polymerase sporulation sigma factor [Lachnospiraceae bacterium]|nr:SigF/SigG family RNA polymerase sporulation sigma factor [Lachnospiraceae bacterium]MBQ8598467.1 SigF/SigG family RNA polymerase sporulation sigma factor [Lachnospiraceae bacterium]
MENTVLIKRAQAGEKEAREVLIEQNLGLVHHIVKRFLGRGYEAEDLFQIGVIGLIKSIDKFNVAYEVKFSTYAVPLITGEIKRFIRDDGMVKVSRTLKENGMRIKYARERLNNKLNREPTLEEIAVEAALTREEVVLAMEANIQVESIYKSVYQNDGNEIFMVDQLADQKKNEQEEVLNHLVIDQLLSCLPQDEQKLITLRYYQDKTQTEVAKVLGISQVQVSRMEKRILLGMRQKIVNCGEK